MAEINQISDQSLESNPTVVVTGFGLFRNYKVNSSWESVKLLKIKGIDLIIDQIPVAYEEVDKRVQHIWNKYKPILVVHCGVSCLAKSITIETRAVSDKSLFVKPDVNNRLPISKTGNHINVGPAVSQQCPDSVSVNDGAEYIESLINVQKVCDEVNQQFQKGLIPMAAEVSSNAGRFLCEYIFRSSLEMDRKRTAFIHVPEISENCRLEDIKSSLEYTIQTLIKHILETNSNRIPND